MSPWNKTPGRAIRDYLEKREKYVNSETNLVEIDLVRVGDWTRMIGSINVPDDYRATYRVTIVRPESAGILLYPISIRGPLPIIKVPLRPRETAVTLNLRGLIERVYFMGRYDRIDYAQPLSPPFEGAEKQWVDEILQAPHPA